MKFPHLSKKVEAVLRDYPHTRNDDIDLMVWVWAIYYQEKLVWDGDRWVAPLEYIKMLPSEDKISRMRRKFQENGEYPATDPMIVARRTREDKVRKTIVTPLWEESL